MTSDAEPLSGLPYDETSRLAALHALALLDSQPEKEFDALVALGFAASRGEAKRLIAGGGARLDGQPVSDENHRIMLHGNEARLSAGKKKHGILRAE